MARLEWVKLKLDNWGRWCNQQDSGALGYPKQAAFARLGVSSRRGDVIPIQSIDASDTDQAVKSLQGRQSHLYLVLTLHYAKALPEHLVAKKMGCSRRVVANNLERADYAIARYFEDKKAARCAIAK